MGKEKIRSLQGLRMMLFLMIFMFHCGIYIKDTPIYQNLLNGGGTLAVSVFFVLSGFVEGLSRKKRPKTVSEYRVYIKRRIIRFYPYHLIFLVACIPLKKNILLHKGAEAIIAFILNAGLLQSWVSDDFFWLSFNGVTWFLSTSMFLCCITPLLQMIDERLMKKEIKTAYRMNWLIVIGSIFVCTMMSLFVHQNVRYWLYAFPPVRVFDYAGGFFLAKQFSISQTYALKKRETTGRFDFLRHSLLEIVAFLWIFGLMILFPYLGEGMRRSAVYLPASLFLVYIFARGRGVVSRFFEKDWMVRLGSSTFYYMMSHQVIMTYFWIIFDKLSLRGMLPERAVWWFVLGSLVVTILSEPICNQFIKLFFERMCRKRKPL